uniref:Uncharacterized protein n=2 Tax=Anguilla anguilla TaxID=7936 RepID=A0A0E9QCH7_ANGAN
MFSVKVGEKGLNQPRERFCESLHFPHCDECGSESPVHTSNIFMNGFLETRKQPIAYLSRAGKISLSTKSGTVRFQTGI